MNLIHLLRMSRLVRNPPSERRVILVFGVILLALAIGLVDYMGWWPDWMQAERIPRKF